MKALPLLFALSFFLSPLHAQNINLSNGNLFDGEPYLAVHPQNDAHLVVAWMGVVPGSRVVIKTRVSLDGGQSWSPVAALPHYVAGYTSADPSLGFDNNGNLYAVYVDYSGFNTSPLKGAVVICRSTDGGFSWSAPQEVIDVDFDPGKRAIDRPWLAIDRSGGKYDGRIYISTMNAKGASAPFHPYLSYSADSGASFATRYLDSSGWLAGILIPQPMPTPAVAADGIFYAVYPSYVLSQSLLPQFILAASHDGGTSFEYRSVFRSATATGDSLAKTGYLLRCDPSDPAHLAFFFLDRSEGDLDLYMSESFDRGQSWSNKIRINDDPRGNGIMQDLLWAGFDAEGNLIAAWRDRRNGSPGSYISDYEIWAAYRHRDSLLFSENFRLSDTLIPFHDILKGSGNDFMCIRLRSDTLHAVWGDTRSSRLNIMYQKGSPDGTVLSVQNPAGENTSPFFIFPNPARQQIYVRGKDIRQIRLFDAEARLILEKHFKGQRNNLTLDLSDRGAGVYFLEIKSKAFKTLEKVILTE